ncbi:MAG: hypothetical protein KDD47_10865, partial [Acidobacteria bacterium]|nr:hypothetical protein [Acidobacteriota bacterium]
MPPAAERPVWGIVGGLGPLASAEFLLTIYEQYTDVAEQEMPVCLVISDPTFPDRTTRFLAGDFDELTE